MLQSSDEFWSDEHETFVDVAEANGAESAKNSIQQAKVANCALWRSGNRCGVVIGIMSCGDKPCQVAIAQSATIC